MRVIVDVRLAAMFTVGLLVWCVRVLKRRVIMLVAMIADQMLDATCAGVRIVRDVDVIVSVNYHLMPVRYDVLLRHGLNPFRLVDPPSSPA